MTKNALIAALMLTTLAGCGTTPGMAPAASKAAYGPVGARSAATPAKSAKSAGLIVTEAQDFGGSASRVSGRDADGAFELNLVWTAVPHTFLSRLTVITLNGKAIGAAEIARVQAVLRAAAKDPANAKFAKDLQNVVNELGEATAK
jgi:hypothetical protein